MKQWNRERWRTVFPASITDAITTIGILLCAHLLCLFFDIWGYATTTAPVIFVLAAFLVSMLTRGYLWGVLASIFLVLLVNYAFTEPFYQFSFTGVGYPVTFVTLFVVSILTCMLTSRSRDRQRLQLENEKERTRANLLRAVSHDIRTPLTAISGAVSTVLEQQETLPPQKQQQLLTDAYKESQWLIHMVENLLTVTRIYGEGEQGSLTTQPEAAEEVMAGAAAKFRRRFSGIPVSVSAPAELLMVPMDATLIEQVLINLLENAALHGGNVTQISLSVRRQGSVAVFTVQDNGKGIAPDRLPYLFDGYQSRAENRQPDKKRSMGIGLSVCKTIVEAHGGRITGENIPGGARFCVILPLESEEQ